MKTEIYIATHKDYSFPQIAGYIPIHVGKDLTDLDLGIIGDNTGDNISELNPNFCELTALYWMWKNSDADILGLVHYRRYFQKDGILISGNDIASICGKNSLIVAEPEDLYYQKFIFKFSVNVKQQYYLNHFYRDWKIVKEIVEKKYPEYLESFELVEESKSLSFYNMMITSKEIFDNYCEWLFDILFELKNRIDISDYNAYQSRIFGFLSERLFNVYKKYMENHVKIKPLSIHMIK